jgi:hypothetical protein
MAVLLFLVPRSRFEVAPLMERLLAEGQTVHSAMHF